MRNPITDPALLHDLRQRSEFLTVGFTASRQSPDHHQREQMRHLFGYLNLASDFVTGGCVGGDHFIGATLHDLYPHKRHFVVVPADRSRVSDWWSARPDVVAIDMPFGTSYRDRNARLIYIASILIGFPAHAEIDKRSARSGSWQTIRMARQRHTRPSLTIPLEDM